MQLAKELEVGFVETSAKTQENVDEVFKVLAKQLIEKLASTAWNFI